MKSHYEEKSYWWHQGFASFVNPLESHTPPCLHRAAWVEWLAGFEQAKNDLLSDGDKS